MKTVSIALGALALASIVIAHPRPVPRQSSTFPNSTKKGLAYNTASYTVRI